MIWATIAGLAISALSTGIGVAQQKKAARNAQRVEDERANKQEAIDERSLERASRDYFDTSSGKHILNKLNDEYGQRLRGIQGGVNKAGATTETALANTENIQKSKANTLGSLAAGQDMRRERAELRYDASQTNSNNQRSAALQNYYNMSAQAAANAWGNAGKSALAAGMGVDSVLTGDGTKGGKRSKEKNNLEQFLGESSDYIQPYENYV